MSTAAIRESIDSAIGYLTQHPAEARYTDSVATATLESGLRIRVAGPSGEEITTDMPSSVGGTASAPSPGWLFRAALASCAATLIAMRAAQQRIELSRLEVVVDSESDDRGILGIDPGVPAGPLSVRVSVRASTVDGVPADDVVSWAVEHCPVYDAIRRAVPVSISIDR